MLDQNNYYVIYCLNGFAEVSKHLARDRSENNFVWTIKIIVSIITVEHVPYNYFDGLNKIIFRSS